MQGLEKNIALFRENCGSGNFRVKVAAFLCGEDLVVVIAGGTRYHVGAVAMAQPRPSLADPAMISASASVLCVPGHKEDELAREVALKMASLLNRNVTVTAGIHLDDASETDVEQLKQNCLKAVGKLVLRVSGKENG